MITGNQSAALARASGLVLNLDNGPRYREIPAAQVRPFFNSF